MLIRKKRFSIYCLSALSCIPLSSVTYAEATVDQQREQSVAAIRAGQVELGLQQLEVLLQQYPQNQKVLADYIVTAL